MYSTSETSNPTQTKNKHPTQTLSNEYQIVQPSYRLNEKNYLVWSQVVRKKLKGKGKLSHLNGPAPSEEDPKFEAWDEEDSLIMSWL